MDELIVNTPRGPVAGAVEGNGPAVVLIAGLGSTRAIWGDLPARLARQFTVVVLDNRGVGGSRAGDPFSLEGAAEDVAAVLEAAAPEGRGALLGASLGGAIALATAIAHPGCVTALVLASAAAHLSNHGRRSLTLLHDFLLHLPAERVGPSLMSLAFAPPFQERFPGFVDEAADLYGLDPDDVPGALGQTRHLLQGWDLRRNLNDVTCPALVLAGTRDPVVAAEDTRDLAANLPNGTILSLPDAAHSPLAEGGREIIDRVVAFLTDAGLENMGPPTP
jgi:3-oxoadipate enol-lactonase